MISVFVRKTEVEPEAVWTGDCYINYQSSCVNGTSIQNRVPRTLKQRPLSSGSVSTLSDLRLRGHKMATQGHQGSRLQRSTSARSWLAEKSYTVVQDGTNSENYSPSGHLQPLFPDVGSEKRSRDIPHRAVKILKNNTWTGELLRKQSKIEEEYKAIRNFTRSKSNTAYGVFSNGQVYLPPRGYTNFVSGKPLIYQDRPPSGRQKAHMRFMEKMEAQNRMLNDLSDSDDEQMEDVHRGNVLEIPSCTSVDECVHGSSGSACLQLAMDGLRIAKDIERSLSTKCPPCTPYNAEK